MVHIWLHGGPLSDCCSCW